jgi:putative transposase
MERDYAAVSPVTDPQAVIGQRSNWFDHDNAVHPHRTLGYRSPCGFIADQNPT